MRTKTRVMAMRSNRSPQISPMVKQRSPLSTATGRKKNSLSRKRSNLRSSRRSLTNSISMKTRLRISSNSTMRMSMRYA